MGLSQMNEIIKIIMRHASPPLMSGDSVKPSAPLFTYGSTDEFKDMVNDIEATFSTTLPSLDWSVAGEEPVSKFMDFVLRNIK